MTAPDQKAAHDRARVRAAMQSRRGELYMGSMATAHLSAIFGVPYGQPGLDAAIDAADQATLDRAIEYCAPYLAETDEAAHRATAMTAPEQPTPEAQTVETLWRDLCEKDDRTSPEEYPDHALITFDELKYCCESFAAQRDAEERYRQFGIDPANPNPDGSDFHLMNVVDATPPPGDAGERARSLLRRLSHYSCCGFSDDDEHLIAAALQFERTAAASQEHRLTTAIAHWRQEVGKLHSLVDRRTKERDEAASKARREAIEECAKAIVREATYYPVTELPLKVLDTLHKAVRALAPPQE